jgi:uncharacterized YigZ family protein
MKSIIDNFESEMEINKSKFISFVYPIVCEEDVKNLIKNLWNRYSDATHICYAYVLTSPRLEKACDDGEPSGTAGKPLLELIKKRGFENVLLVVVRYFGGIKLGAGGLVRAYTNSGNLVLDQAKVVEMIDVGRYVARIDCSMSAKLLGELKRLGVEILSTNYSQITEIEFVGDCQNELQLLFRDIEIVKMGTEKRCQK